MIEAAFGLAIVRNRILMVQLSTFYRRHGLRWTFPGGLIDDYEDSQAAAIREVWEETGVRFYPTHRYATGNEGVPCEFFLGGAEEGDEIPHSMEINDRAWMTYEEAIRLPLAYEKTNLPILHRLRHDQII